MEIIPFIQHYDWGKVGEFSAVAKFYKECNKSEDYKIDNKPYAELWMGTHPSGPAVLASNRNETLLSHIQKSPDEILGSGKRYGNLTFLFKVLSINKALSVQAHPSKTHAEELHRNFPDIYKDPNHKPEMAIALTPFEVLCGFRVAEQIKYFFKEIPEFENLVGLNNYSTFLTDDSKNDVENLKVCYQAVLLFPKENLSEILTKILRRLDQIRDKKQKQLLMVDLVERLNSDFPNDVGIISPYFFNYFTLLPGEALFLAANIPHAYISGDCVECMACSDNVVRAGLTPKFKDVETLIGMLDYNGHSAEHFRCQGLIQDQYTSVFIPCVMDFAIARTIIDGSAKYELAKRNSASILIVTDGVAKCDKVVLKNGSVIFLSAEETLTFTTTDHLCLYQAFSNI